MNATALSVVRYQDDINTEHNLKSVCRAAVAMWTKLLTRNGQTRVQNWKGANILLLQNLTVSTYKYRIFRILFKTFN